MDSAKSHLGEKVEESLKKEDASVKSIHTGTTPCFNFWTLINKPFKDRMKEKWEEWISNGEQEFTKSRNRRRASYELVARWANDVWMQVAQEENIIQGFRQNGYIDFNGDLQNLHSKLRETIVERGVPHEVIQEMENPLQELQQLKTSEVEELEDETSEVEELDDETSEVEELDDETSEVEELEDETNEVEELDDETNEVEELDDETSEVEEV